MTIPLSIGLAAGISVGADVGSPVMEAGDYKPPFAFTGTVKKVTFDLKPETIDAEKELHEHSAVQGVGGGAAG